MGNWQAQQFPLLAQTWLWGFKIQNLSLLAQQLYVGKSSSVAKIACNQNNLFSWTHTPSYF